MMHSVFQSLVLLCLVSIVACKRQVIVSGAAGRTGSLVFQKLLKSSEFTPVGIVKSDKSKKKLLKLGAKDDQIVVADITNFEAISAAFEGSDSLILCTSAVPKIKIFSLIKIFFLKLLGKSVRPEFYFPSNGDPYCVDWLGAKNQIDAATKAKMKQVIFLSSMGGTQSENFLNTIGRKPNDEKSGNILLWKRKAEEYLIQSGGLLDKAGGNARVIMGFDDQLLIRKVRNIPRDDVAEVCVQALTFDQAKDKSFDIIAVEESGVSMDWNTFFSTPGTCKY